MYEHPFEDNFRLRTQFGTDQSNNGLFALRTNVDNALACHYSALIPVKNRPLLEAALALVNTPPIQLELPYGPGATEIFYAFGMTGDGNCMFTTFAFLKLCLQQSSTKMQTNPRQWVRKLLPTAHSGFETSELLANVLNGGMARAQRNLALTSSCAYDESTRGSVLQLLGLWSQLGCSLDESSVLVDGGAGIGVFLLWAADATGCTAIGVEQDPGLLDGLHLIQEALHRAGWTGRVATRVGKMHAVQSLAGITHFSEYRGAKARINTYQNLARYGPTPAEDQEVWERLFETASLKVWSSTKASPQILTHLAKTSRAISQGLCAFRCITSPALHFANNTFTVFTYVRLPTSRQDVPKEIPEGPVKDMITFAGLQKPGQTLAYAVFPDQLPGGPNANPHYRKVVGGWQIFGGAGLIILTRATLCAPGNWIEFRRDSPATKEAIFFGTARLPDSSNLFACVYDPEEDTAFLVPCAGIIGKMPECDDYASITLPKARLKELIKEKLQLESGAETPRRSARKQEASAKISENRQQEGATLHCLFPLTVSSVPPRSAHVYTEAEEIENLAKAEAKKRAEGITPPARLGLGLGSMPGSATESSPQEGVDSPHALFHSHTHTLSFPTARSLFLTLIVFHIDPHMCTQRLKEMRSLQRQRSRNALKV